MRYATILCWRRTPDDSRDTCSSMSALRCPQQLALPAALEIRECGANIGGAVFPAGFSVHVKYASGRMRCIRPSQMADYSDELRDKALAACELPEYTKRDLEREALAAMAI